MPEKSVDKKVEEELHEFSHWTKLYILVLINLFLWITLFYILRRIFE